MTQSMHCVSSKVINLPTYDGLNDVDVFLNAFEKEVPEKQRFEDLDWALRAMLARWLGTQEGRFDDWHECRRVIKTNFGKLKV